MAAPGGSGMMGPLRGERLRVSAAVGQGRPDDWAVAVKTCLDRLGPVPSSGLGLIYINDAFARHASSIVTLLRRLTGLADWIGCASEVVMAAGPSGVEILAESEGGPPGLAVMILAFPADSCHPIRLPTEFGSSVPGMDPAAESWRRQTDLAGALFHADARNPAAIQVVTGAARHLGSASVGSSFKSAAVGAALSGRAQICGAVTEGGATGVLFTEAACGVVGIAQGCGPIGPVRRIGKMSGDAVMTLDGVPARSAFNQDIGDLLARDPARTEGFVFAGLIRADSGEARTGGATGARDRPDPVIEPGNYEVAAILDPAGLGDGLRLSIVAVPGDALVFVRRDQIQALTALDRMVDRLIRGVGRDRIRGGHLVTAADRLATLFGDPGVEFVRVADRLGPVPLIGFQCDAPIVGETLYSRSAVLTLWADLGPDQG